jgi:hypothetical protein
MKKSDEYLNGWSAGVVIGGLLVVILLLIFLLISCAPVSEISTPMSFEGGLFEENDTIIDGETLITG